MFAFTSYSLVRAGASFVRACFRSALAIHLVGVEFGAVAGQVEDLDLVLVLGQPCLHRLAVVHPPVVQDQVDLVPRVLDEAAQEVE